MLETLCLWDAAEISDVINNSSVKKYGFFPIKDTISLGLILQELI